MSKETLSVIKEQKILEKDFRMYGTIEDPLFLAKDVANWIEHNKPSELVQLVDKDEKLEAIITHSGQNRKMWFLTEDGLYEVLMQSRKPIAKRFKKGVKEILKDIRKHGAYLTDDKIEEVLTNPDTIIKLATQIKEERALRKAAEEKVEVMTPKAIFADQVVNSIGAVDMGQFAKIVKDENINIGRNRLFTWLRDNGFLMNNNTPYQRYIDNNWFVVIDTVVNKGRGDEVIPKTLVTGRGQFNIVKKLKEAV